MTKHPIAILNAPVVTAPGRYEYWEINASEAKALIERYGFESFVGHETTAKVLSLILGIPVPTNRGEFRQKPGQMAVVFKLNARLEEGRVISTEEELEQIGYKLHLLKRIDG